MYRVLEKTIRTTMGHTFEPGDQVWLETIDGNEHVDVSARDNRSPEIGAPKLGAERKMVSVGIN